MVISISLISSQMELYFYLHRLQGYLYIKKADNNKILSVLLNEIPDNVLLFRLGLEMYVNWSFKTTQLHRNPQVA